MSRIKIALAIIVIVCIVTAAFLWIYFQPQGEPELKPEFEIVNFAFAEMPGHVSGYQIIFYVNNTGAGNATGLHGTIVLTHAWNETWRVYPEDFVLEPGEVKYVSVGGIGWKPLEETITIIVECNEGVTQQFIEPLS